jgi:hypothetical protein
VAFSIRIGYGGRLRLIQVIAMVLAELGIGGLLMTSLLSPREIRLSFFTFNSLLSALATAMALMLTKMVLGSAWFDVRFLGLTVIGATVAYGSFRLEKLTLGRVALIVSGLLGLIFGLLPMTEKMLEVQHIQTDASYFFGASALAGALLLGATNVTMILGHWYLVMRRLSFEHLERMSQILLATIGLRIAVVVGTLLLLGHCDPDLAASYIPNLWDLHGNLFFFVMRVLWGLALPLVLGFMVRRCVQEKANQAATGMLYVIEISVLFGELFAAYLLI